MSGRKVVDSIRLTLAEIDVLLEKNPDLNSAVSIITKLAHVQATLEAQLIGLKEDTNGSKSI